MYRLWHLYSHDMWVPGSVIRESKSNTVFLSFNSLQKWASDCEFSTIVMNDQASSMFSKVALLILIKCIWHLDNTVWVLILLPWSSVDPNLLILDYQFRWHMTKPQCCFITTYQWLIMKIEVNKCLWAHDQACYQNV